MSLLSHFVPPGFRPGETRFFLCEDCGKSFSVKMSLFSLFARPRCPKCGGSRVIPDPRIRH
jgi:DNA-directed RNA polymerase subunit RPC12/RpoP